MGDEPEVIPGSAAARAITLIEKAADAIVELEDAKLRLVGHIRMTAVAGFMVACGDMNFPLTGEAGSGDASP